MKRLLLTGFEPFLEFKVNPTEEIVKALHGKVIGDYEIFGKVLPVDFDQTAKQAIRYIDDVDPDVVIALGLAGGRMKITPERVAINCADGAPDNNGFAQQDAPIIQGGPTAYFSTLPIRSLIDELQEQGYPAQISNSAGTYLCNFVMYHILHHINTNEKSIHAGFFHIPASHELSILQTSLPSWSQNDLRHSIEIIIQTLSMGESK
ncbi:pyroglutamyl-peptidase I [Bacillus suaedaesalsae]|uniref:Pyrrolidone-carboxylate peptidase n=1 Tax=Bacillus suaedaesalsae TaxID=2810349 RepID=A0ABS2DE38_9BACI|nr:pyroglutamyl-peptidase I [Bacillus suaedaesalsae]MBM6616722.1 pyroglutamyl-peptidase I [Bacillus suaedaesalsae]